MSIKELNEFIELTAKDLPESKLKEIADFVMFLKLKSLHINDLVNFKDNDSDNQVLKLLSKFEEMHLEKEFESYREKYPVE